ncbi:1-phosphofructokinase [Staphylococcus massiliensis]|uniref:Tagatose-6-phosphate kinase n=1 Tax=Staphylococcus massiliensis S46 TaxID=1229783 RepID=K9B448_9STAP|nr:1-phosphofructokinase [Staphylococcus massiliensis]EKU48565.1 fructose 1-phosphate kinase [Staphylococcus massiliensis S46]POA00617.1 1-phosphofructokinase [Staphylococcus massiliensis CCUG 55927]
MIYTITFNPSVDYVMETSDFKEGSLNRSQNTYKFAGGKGINVSRILNSLGVKSVAYGFIGGFTGSFIKKVLKEEGISTNFVELEQDSRINVKLKGIKETEINASGPFVSNEDFKALCDEINQINKGDIVIVSGSVPPSLSKNVYSDIAKIVKNKCANLVVDAEKDLLLSTLEYQPLLIKPNLNELEEIFNTSISTEEEVIKYGRKLIEKGARSIIVSLGADGAIYLDNDYILKATVPKGSVVNTIGAGDSTVAGMIAGIANKKGIKTSFKLAIASGSATAFSKDLATGTKIESLINDININFLD